jgi:hypothetical protein
MPSKSQGAVYEATCLLDDLDEFENDYVNGRISKNRLIKKADKLFSFVNQELYGLSSILDGNKVKSYASLYRTEEQVYHSVCLILEEFVNRDFKDWLEDYFFENEELMDDILLDYSFLYELEMTTIVISAYEVSCDFFINEIANKYAELNGKKQGIKVATACGLKVPADNVDLSSYLDELLEEWQEKEGNNA